MSNTQQIIELHQAMKKEIRKYPSGELKMSQLYQLRGLCAAMIKVVEDEAAEIQTNMDMRALGMLNIAHDWITGETL